MDSNIILSYGSKTVSTVISNTFIDNFMADANGGYIKVYIYLLRCHQDPTRTVTIASIADALDETEKYVRMALQHWNDQGVISISKNKKGQITNIVVHDLDDMDELPDSEEDEEDEFDEPIVISTTSVSNEPVVKEKSSVPQKNDANIPHPNYTAATMTAFKSTCPDFAGLLNYLEANIFKKPLSVPDMQPICFIFEQLEFPTDLISYLYDYCYNTMGKTNSKYIETVAMNWHGAGIRTIDAAKQEVESFSSAAQTVKSALSLSDRLKPAEVDVITRWSREYGFSDELLREACNRAVLQTSKPSLNYIDKIVTDWHNKDVKNMDDIKKLDEAHAKNKAGAGTNSLNREASPIRQPKGAYFQYPQRTYTEKELTDIEKKKLRQSKLLAQTNNCE